MSRTLPENRSTFECIHHAAAWPGTSSGSNGDHGLPDYESELADFHQAFAQELTALVALLPVSNGKHILDVCCGDGFYLNLLARELKPRSLVGLDANPACLDLARQTTRGIGDAPILLIEGTLEDYSAEAEFDLVWCAQSLFSLPDPLAAVRKMSTLVRPGGIVAILENDSLHQAILPLPSRIELAVRQSEHDALAQETRDPEQYYVGRRLPAILSEAGLTSIEFRTQSIDRMAPLDRPLERFLASYLRRLADRVTEKLAPELAREFHHWFDPLRPSDLLRQPQFAMTWINVVAWGRRPSTAEIHSTDQ